MPETNHNPYPRSWDERAGETYYLHRAIAEWKLGRPLASGEVVHHENGDKEDYHPDNIWIFSSQRAHMLYEHYQTRVKQGVIHLLGVEEILRIHNCWLVR